MREVMIMRIDGGCDCGFWIATFSTEPETSATDDPKDRLTPSRKNRRVRTKYLQQAKLRLATKSIKMTRGF